MGAMLLPTTKVTHPITAITPVFYNNRFVTTTQDWPISLPHHQGNYNELEGTLNVFFILLTKHSLLTNDYPLESFAAQISSSYFLSYLTHYFKLSR